MPDTKLDTLDTPAARGLRAALARRGKLKASASPAAPALAKPKATAKVWREPKTEAEIARFNAANARIQAVMAHPAFTAHSKVAAKLLMNPRLSAAEISNLLDLAASTTPAEMDSALSAMQAALAEQRIHNPNATAIGSQSASSGGIWERAYAKLGIAAELAR
jgi:hypothetical protein